MSNAGIEVRQRYPAHDGIPAIARPPHYDGGKRYLVDGAVAATIDETNEQIVSDIVSKRLSRFLSTDFIL